VSTFLVFGARGALGSAIVRSLRDDAHSVLVAGRTVAEGIDVGTSDTDWVDSVATPLDGVVWAQGTNSSGTIVTSGDEQLLDSFEANVGFIHRTLGELVRHGKLENPARLVVLSSIWQDHARANKFAYMTTKAAIKGLVKSAAIDLAPQGIAVNAVLPGVIDTPMTRANLSAEQVERIEADSLGGQLARPEDVAETTKWLLSPLSRGVNAQFITVDAGWTVNRHV